MKRFHFKNQILNNISAIVPWISAFLIISLFLSMENHFALQAGMEINIPKAPTSDYVKPNMVALIVKLTDAFYGKEGREAVFFDDERFLIKYPLHLEKLKERFKEKAAVNSESTLLLVVDGNISYATTMEIVQLASEAGMKHILFSTE